jgi:hypothetical protein
MKVTRANCKHKVDYLAKLGLWRVAENACDKGGVRIDYYRGFHLELITNDLGGVRNLNGFRMNAKEFYAWLEGVEYAATLKESHK